MILIQYLTQGNYMNSIVADEYAPRFPDEIDLLENQIKKLKNIKKPNYVKILGWTVMRERK